jgi:hypothetical protein
MTKGVVAGVRTLFWAFVMLLSIVYLCALVLRQTIGLDQHVMNQANDYVVLFGDIPGSMFSTFRCFMTNGDCILLDSTPIPEKLYQLYGYGFVIPYALMTMFITFGIFNMVTAVFVENVMEAAKQKKVSLQVAERARVGQVLSKLVFRVASTRRDQEEDGGMVVNVTSSMKISKRDNWKTKIVSVNVNGFITRAAFINALQDPVVIQLIDSLEVNVSDQSEMFDILDSDGSGSIEIAELISGLIKLRSVETKQDVVALILGMRGIRDSLRTTSKQVAEMSIFFGIADQSEK